MKISKKDDPNTYIFLPVAGGRGASSFQVGDFGYYWSGTASSRDKNKPYLLFLNNGGVNAQDNRYRDYVGHPVRPERGVKVSVAGRVQGETEGIEEDVFKY